MLEPAAALAPQTAGAYRIEPAQPDRITALSPFDANGLPPPGKAETRPGGVLLWAGHGLWLATGTAPALTPATDATDAWVVLRLSGPAPDAVLARLTPIDLRPLHFRPGQVARSLVGHIAALLHRPEAAPEVLEIWLPRSMAAHAEGEIAEAARALAAR